MANNFKAVLAPVVWVVFGIVGLLITLDYMGPLPTFELGAAFWPQVILVGIILVSFIQILSIFFSRSTTNQITSDPLLNGEAQSLKEADEAVFLNVNVRTLAIFLLPLVYVYGMHQFGFFLVTTVFLPLYMYVMGVREVKKIFFVSLTLREILPIRWRCRYYDM